MKCNHYFRSMPVLQLSVLSVFLVCALVATEQSTNRRYCYKIFEYGDYTINTCHNSKITLEEPMLVSLLRNVRQELKKVELFTKIVRLLQKTPKSKPEVILKQIDHLLASTEMFADFLASETSDGYEFSMNTGDFCLADGICIPQLRFSIGFYNQDTGGGKLQTVFEFSLRYTKKQVILWPFTVTSLSEISGNFNSEDFEINVVQQYDFPELKSRIAAEFKLNKEGIRSRLGVKVSEVASAIASVEAGVTGKNARAVVTLQYRTSTGMKEVIIDSDDLVNKIKQGAIHAKQEVTEIGQHVLKLYDENHEVIEEIIVDGAVKMQELVIVASNQILHVSSSFAKGATDASKKIYAKGKQLYDEHHEEIIDAVKVGAVKATEFVTDTSKNMYAKGKQFYADHEEEIEDFKKFAKNKSAEALVKTGELLHKTSKKAVEYSGRVWKAVTNFVDEWRR